MPHLPHHARPLPSRLATLPLGALALGAVLLSASCGTDNSAEIKALREDVARLSQLQSGPDRVVGEELRCWFVENINPGNERHDVEVHDMPWCLRLRAQDRASRNSAPLGGSLIRMQRELTIKTRQGTTYRVVTDIDEAGIGVPPLKIGDEWPPK